MAVLTAKPFNNMGKCLQLRYWGSGACYTLMHTRGLFRLGDKLKGWAPKLYALYNASHSHFSVIQDQRVEKF